MADIEQLKFDWHRDHIDWKGVLDLYLDEIKFYYKKLNDFFDSAKSDFSKMELIDEFEALLETKKDRIVALKLQMREEESSWKTQKDFKELSKNHQDLARTFLQLDADFKKTKEHLMHFFRQVNFLTK